MTAAEPLKREALDARIEEVLAQVFSVSVDFEIDDALAQSGKEWADFFGTAAKP